MSVLTFPKIALRSLRAHPMRSGLTMLGVVIGVAGVVIMGAIGEGASTRVSEQLRGLGTNLVAVLPGSQQRGGVQFGQGTMQTLTEADAAAIKKDVPFVQVAAPTISKTSQIVYGNLNWSTNVAGVVPDYLVGRDWSMASGQPFGEREVAERAKVALIGATIADELFKAEDPVGRTVRIEGVPFTVLGVLARKGASAGGRDEDDRIYIPLSAARASIIGNRYQVNRRAVDFILVRATPEGDLAALQSQMRALLRQRHRLGHEEPDDFVIRNLTAVQETQEQSSRTMGRLLAALASVALVVGGISVMNIMLVSVSERTREIGLRMAIGARPRDLFNQFLLEAMMLTLLGGLAGIVVGIAGAAAVAVFAGWPVIVSPGAMLSAVVFSLAVGAVFGIYPAVRASRLEPIAALQAE